MEILDQELDRAEKIRQYVQDSGEEETEKLESLLDMGFDLEEIFEAVMGMD